MAENNEKTNGGQPPKINPNGTPAGMPAPGAPPQVRPTLSPKTRMIDPNAPKKETTRIDLSSVISIPKGVAPHDDKGFKKSPARVNGSSGITPISEEEKQEIAKKSTIRIDKAEITPLPEDDKNEAAKKSTVRVQIDEERAKGDTTKLDAKAIAGAEESAKKRTARIDLSEVLDESDDIFKRRTALLDASKFAGVSEAPGAPRTIRIKRPETPPTTVLKKPESLEEEEAVTVTEPDSAKKSETARIDLPPEATEQPPTRRKTIRIKRPEGVSSKPLVIGKAEAETEQPEEIVAAPQPVEAEAGALFSILALVAVLVSIGLITVQTLALRSFLQF